MQDSTKMLPPFREEGYSPNENVGFPVTTKVHAEEEDHSANGHVGFQSQQNHMFPKGNTLLMKHYLFKNEVANILGTLCRLIQVSLGVYRVLYTFFWPAEFPGYHQCQQESQ